MKKTSFIILSLAAVISCQESTTEDYTQKDLAFSSIAESFIDNTLAPTYTALAAESCRLADEISTLEKERSQAGLERVCSIFLEARKQWELSEAFLYGAATICGIDPHIDSWPLDEDGYKALMSSPAMLEKLKGEDGASWAGDNLGNGLLGFHGMEYILFQNGESRNVAAISENQYIYLKAIAGDLRNRTVQLEVAWLGENSPEEHRELISKLEYETQCDGSGFSYAENLLKAGQAGSSLPSMTAAMQYMLDGAITIADEVGTSKIGKPYNPLEEGDTRYIESPYSWNSICDFRDNILSVENMYYGGIEGRRGASLHLWMSRHHSELDSEICKAIESALQEIGLGKEDSGNGMVYPFVNNIKNEATLEAIEACGRLVKALEKAKEAVKE